MKLTLKQIVTLAIVLLSNLTPNLHSHESELNQEKEENQQLELPAPPKDDEFHWGDGPA